MFDKYFLLDDFSTAAKLPIPATAARRSTERSIYMSLLFLSRTSCVWSRLIIFGDVSYRDQPPNWVSRRFVPKIGNFNSKKKKIKEGRGWQRQIVYCIAVTRRRRHISRAQGWTKAREMFALNVYSPKNPWMAPRGMTNRLTSKSATASDNRK